MDFDTAFTKLLGHEGGFVSHPSDPGGATNWGVTEKVARANGYTGDMREYPQSEAKRIYRRSYWDAVRADDIPPLLRYAVFDAAVNSGARQSILWLQRAIGADSDGMIGPQTISLARAAQPDFALRRMLAQRLNFMANLPTWPHFGRGWARRISDLLEA